MLGLALLLLLLGAFTALYFWATADYGWFTSRGIPEVPAYFPLGSANMWSLWMGKVPFQMNSDEVTKYFPHEKLIGYMSPKPQLVVNDLELAKLILIKDFDSFTDRRVLDFEPKSKADKIMQNMLTALKGDKWRRMRNTLSPVFSSGKLRNMMPLLHKVGADFVTHLNEVAEKKEDLNGKDTMINFTMDAIVTCGIGVEANTLNNPDSIYKKMVKRLKNPKPLLMFKIFFFLTAPKLAQRLMSIDFIDKEFMDFLIQVIEKSMDHRKGEQGVRRNDFIDMALDSLRSADQKEASKGMPGEDISKEELEMLLVSNVLILIFGGFDTSSTMLTATLWFLSKHPDLQESLAQEIREAIDAKGDCQLDYNTIMELPQLDMFLHEVTRMYPLTSLERQCVKDYRVPGTNLVIPAGMTVQIPVKALMENNFPNADVFNPENFSAENKTGRNPFTYLTFGQGPRNCIGIRLAMLQMKVAIVYLLANFEVKSGLKNPDKLEHAPRSTSMLPKGEVTVRIEKRN